jgi:hypothetical protein
MYKISVPKRWFLVIAGFSSYDNETALELPFEMVHSLNNLIDDYLLRIIRDLREHGAINASLFWSNENLSPAFFLVDSKENNNFLKKLRNRIEDAQTEITNSLKSQFKDPLLIPKLENIIPEGKILILSCTIPLQDKELMTEEEALTFLANAFNAEFLTIKRAAHDFKGRSKWLAALTNVFSRKFIRPVGPVKKMELARKVMAKRHYEQQAPGDFEQIHRYLLEAIPYRKSLLEFPSTSQFSSNEEPLGHLIIHYFTTKGEFPPRFHFRTTTSERLGRKVELLNWAQKENVSLDAYDSLQIFINQIIYERIEKVLANVGAIKLDALWSLRNRSINVYFLSKFSFTEDILTQMKQIQKEDPRSLLEPFTGIKTTEIAQLWNELEVNHQLLILEINGFDSAEGRKLAQWISQLKKGQLPGPGYSAEKEALEKRHFRPI